MYPFGNMSASTVANRLATAAAAVRSASPREAGAIGICPAFAVTTALPHREPRDDAGRPLMVHMTTNGAARMTLRAGTSAVDDADEVPLGVPFGAVARLLLIHVATDAARAKSRHVDLGPSLAVFLRRLGLSTGGGKRGRPRYVRDQLQRLLGAVITTERAYVSDDQRFVDGDHLVIADQYRLWTAGPRRDEAEIVLGERFYDHVMARGVPVDLRKIAALRSSSLALDLYVWLTYRSQRLAQSGRSEVAVRWSQLHDQFGGGYRADESGLKEFARSARRALNRIRILWPDLDVDTPSGRLVLRSTRPDVPRRTAVHAY